MEWNMIWEGIIGSILILYIQLFPFVLLLWLQISILKYQRKLFWVVGIFFVSIMGVHFSIGMEIDSERGDPYGWIKYIVWMTINYILMARQLYLIRKIKNTKEIKNQ
jgi:hypothetical protein